MDAQTLMQGFTKDASPLISKAQAQILQAQMNENSNPQAAKDVLKDFDPADKKRRPLAAPPKPLSAELSK